MKKLVAAVVFLLVVTAGSAGANLLYTPTGFRDMEWGDSHKKLGPECVLIDKELDYGTVYARRNEKLDIADVKLQGITYSFYNDKFLNVTLEIAGKKDFDRLKAFAIERYGTGNVKRNSQIESHRWDDDNVFIILDFIPQTSEGQLLVTYVPILEEVVMEIEKRRAKYRPTTPEEMDTILN